MNVFHKVVRENLRKNRTRTLVTVLGVMLSAALITGVTVFGYSLLQVLKEDAIVRYGDWHLSVANVDEAFLEEQSGRNEVDAVGFYEQYGYAALPTEENEILNIIAFPDETFTLLPMTVFSGRLPQNDRELLLGANIASDAGVGWKVGETITLRLDDKDKTYTIVGICAKPKIDLQYSGKYTAVTCWERSDIGAKKTALIKLKNPYAIAAYAESLEYESAYHANLLRFMGIWDDPADSLLTQLMAVAGTVIIGIIMTGSVFLIFNAFNISLNERIREIGLLASMGATPSQIRTMVLYEGLCIGVIGIPLGMGIGVTAIFILIRAIADSFSKMIYLNLPLNMYLSILILLLAVVVSLLTILISAYIPARKAAKMPVMECIRQTNEIKVSGKSLKTRKLSEKIWGFTGALALKNFKRNQKKYQSIILSLVLSIVLFIVTSSFTDCFQRISEKGEVVTDYDIGFSSTEMSDTKLHTLWDTLKNEEGITESTLQAVYYLDIKAESSQYTATVQFIDEESYLKCLERWEIDSKELGQMFPAVAKRNEEADSITELPDLFFEKHVPAEMNGKEVTLYCIEQLMPDVPPFREDVETFDYTLMILAPWSQKDFLADSQEPFTKGMTFCTNEPEESYEAIDRKIQGASITEEYLFLNNAAVFNQSRSLIFIANVFSYTFIVMISLIAVANVFNTISTNINLRRRELAMLRSVGMGEKEFQRMMRFECVFYGLRAILFGVPISLTLSYLIQNWMMDGLLIGDDTAFHMPWSSLGIGIISVLLIIFVTMMYTVGKLKQENIIDALRDEMT